MAKLVWIDVGTHRGQEYRAIFDDGYYRVRMARRRVSALLGRGTLPSKSARRAMKRSRARLKARRGDLHVAMIEANPRLLGDAVYAEADDRFAVAMGRPGAGAAGIARLFHANADAASQGNSIYAAKHNVAQGDFTRTLLVDPRAFSAGYRAEMDDAYGDYRVMLRLNCEGSEKMVIEAFRAAFGERLALVMGSLLDVQKVHGDATFDAMMADLGANEGFVPFSERMEDWPRAFAAIEALLDGGSPSRR